MNGFIRVRCKYLWTVVGGVDNNDTDLRRKTPESEKYKLCGRESNEQRAD